MPKEVVVRVLKVKSGWYWRIESGGNWKTLCRSEIYSSKIKAMDTAGDIFDNLKNARMIVE